jgi:small conductance mechanosensitive channel
MNKLSEPLNGYLPFVFDGLRLLVIIGVGVVLSVIINRLLRALKKYAVRWMVGKGQLHDVELEKRANTIVTVVRRPALVLLWTAVGLMALKQLGVRVEPLLAGAGVSAGIVGVAVGVGAQSVIKDLIGGMFMLLENQIRVGDVAVINGTGGLVEEINLRTTVLRSENGAVHIFPNGGITALANLTREFAHHVVELTVDYEEDVDGIVAAVKELAEELRADPTFGPLILDSLEMMGIDRFVQTGVVVKARIKTLPQKQWTVGRELNRRIQLRFAETGVFRRPGVSAVRMESIAGAREELKAAVREVLAEMKGR